MSKADHEPDPTASARSPDAVMRIALEQMRQGTTDLVRMASNPLSYIPEPLVPLCLLLNPWLRMFA